MKKIDIHPTHTCFDDAIDLLTTMVKEDNSLLYSDKVKVVHGICHDIDLNPFSHAWLEVNDDSVWFAGMVSGEKIWCEADKNQYYQKMLVTDRTKYSPIEVCQNNLESFTYGPWEQKYKELCRDYKKPEPTLAR